MVKKKITEIQDNDILATPVMTLEYQVILPQGATLKKDYIEKLKELGITEVAIKEKEIDDSEIVILKSDIERNFKEKVKDILERHTYQKNKKLTELSKTADNIISYYLIV